jgi:hypothetical protein
MADQFRELAERWHRRVRRTPGRLCRDSGEKALRAGSLSTNMGNPAHEIRLPSRLGTGIRNRVVNVRERMARLSRFPKNSYAPSRFAIVVGERPGGSK